MISGSAELDIYILIAEPSSRTLSVNHLQMFRLVMVVCGGTCNINDNEVNLCIGNATWYVARGARISKPFPGTQFMLTIHRCIERRALVEDLSTGCLEDRLS